MEEYHIIQNLIIQESAGIPDALYYTGNYRHDEKALLIEADGEVVFSTYFNTFSARQWQELTEIRQVLFQLQLQGEGTIELWRADAAGTRAKILSLPFSYAAPALFQTELISLDKLGEASWLAVHASGSPVKLFSGAVLTDAAPLRAPKLACCFCTYKREKEIRKNVENLLSGIGDPESALCNAADIFIADNGHTLSPEEFGNSDHVFLYENPNYGGSAGFTRCIIEAGIHRKGHYSHIVLMDDDALIQDYVMERLVRLLSFLKGDYLDYLIGGALLSLQRPWLQAENGAELRNRGNILKGSQMDLRDFETVINNQQPEPDVRVNYNAWFFACFSADFVSENNLPLPFFLHGDDIEYSLRFQNRLIHMNGLCVWHPEPGSNRRPYITYYDQRNYSIIEAIYDRQMTAGKYFTTELRKIMKLLTQFRYAEAMYSLWAVRDFLAGPDHLLTQNHESLNRELMRWKKYESCSFPDVQSIDFEQPLIQPKSRPQKLADMLLPGKGTAKYYDGTVSYGLIDFSGVKDIFIVDRTTGKGIVLCKDREQYRSALRESRTVFPHILKEYRETAEAWRASFDKLKSYRFWKDYLEL